ncbi:MAG: hypothetical protein JXK94_00860 [Deltaproteobacteria bacterium]|nr:hypothetical protein [Deltaproteobacteria bacterium]
MRILVLSVSLCIVLSAGSAFAAETNVRTLRAQPAIRTVAPAGKQVLQFKPVTAVKINRAVITRLPQLRPIGETTTKAQGPDPKATLDLNDVIDDAGLLDDLGEAGGWNANLILQDKAAGHVFYYLPREILLLHDADGYKLSVQYNYQSEKGKPSVLISADMGAPFRSGDVILLKAVLREALDLKKTDPLELKALPGLGAEADFQALSAGFAIPAEQINITPPAHLKQPFRLTLSLTQDGAEEVLAQMSREGVIGTLKVPVGDQTVPIPIRLQYSQFSGDRTQGFDEWVKGRPTGKLGNLTSFPVEIESINAYRQVGNRLERVAKNLKKTKPLSPGGKRSFNLPAADKLLGQGVLVAWLGTSLNSDCTSCLQSIDREVRKGVALAPASPVIFEAIPGVFSELGIYKILVRVKSPYFVAGGGSVKDREIELTEEANRNEELQLYVPEGKGENPLLYRFQLQAVLDSGGMAAETGWHDANGLRQFIGTAQMETILNPEEAAEGQ